MGDAVLVLVGGEDGAGVDFGVGLADGCLVGFCVHSTRDYEVVRVMNFR